MTPDLKSLNLDPLVERAFDEIDIRLSALSNDLEAINKFMDSLDEAYIEPLEKELIKAGRDDAYISIQYLKGWDYLRGKYYNKLK